MTTEAVCAIGCVFDMVWYHRRGALGVFGILSVIARLLGRNDNRENKERYEECNGTTAVQDSHGITSGN
jgi:hypothetical protein